jgi:hypothetical protein
VLAFQGCTGVLGVVGASPWEVLGAPHLPPPPKMGTWCKWQFTSPYPCVMAGQGQAQVYMAGQAQVALAQRRWGWRARAACCNTGYISTTDIYMHDRLSHPLPPAAAAAAIAAAPAAVQGYQPAPRAGPCAAAA